MFAAAIRGAAAAGRRDLNDEGVVRKRRFRSRVNVPLYLCVSVSWRSVVILLLGTTIAAGGTMLCVVGFHRQHFVSTEIQLPPSNSSDAGGSPEGDVVATAQSREDRTLTLLGAILVGVGAFVVIIVIVIVMEKRDVILKELMEKERRRRMNRPDLYDLIIERMRRNRDLELKSDNDYAAPNTPTRRQSIFQMLTRRLSIRSNRSTTSNGTIAQALRRLPAELFIEPAGGVGAGGEVGAGGGMRRAVSVNDRATRNALANRLVQVKAQMNRASSLPVKRSHAELSPMSSGNSTPRVLSASRRGGHRRSMTLEEVDMVPEYIGPGRPPPTLHGVLPITHTPPTPTTPHLRSRPGVSPLSFTSFTSHLEVNKSESESMSPSPIPDVTKQQSWPEYVEPLTIADCESSCMSLPQTPCKQPHTPQKQPHTAEPQPPPTQCITVEPQTQPAVGEAGQHRRQSVGSRHGNVVSTPHGAPPPHILVKQPHVSEGDVSVDGPVESDPASLSAVDAHVTSQCEKSHVLHLPDDHV